MRIFITGVSGYIGSYLANFLLDQGHEIFGCDLKDLPEHTHLHESHFGKFDLRDLQKTKDFLNNLDIECIIHLAAYIEVGESETDPLKYFNNNIITTINILESMKACGIKKLLFSSTAAVYGDKQFSAPFGDFEPICEDATLRPNSVYGESKLICENIIRATCSVEGFDCIIFRFFNVAGGKIPPHSTHLFPILYRSIQNNIPLKINGDDYPTPDGTCIRDYISIRDLGIAQIKALDYIAHVKASDYLEKNASGLHEKKKEKCVLNIVNLGTCHGYSVREITQNFFICMDKTIPVNVVMRRPGDPAILVASNARARELLKWEPSEDIIHLIKNFIQDNKLKDFQTTM